MYDIVCDDAHTIGKNLYKAYDYYDTVWFLAISYMVRTMSYKKHTMSYTTSYAISHIRLARTCKWTYDIVCSTYDIVYE